MNIIKRLYYELKERNCVKVIIIPYIENARLKPFKWFIVFEINGSYYGISSGPLRSMQHYFNRKIKDSPNLEKHLYILNKETKLYYKKSKQIIEKLAGNRKIIYTFLSNSSQSLTQFRPLIKDWCLADVGINKFIIFAPNAKIMKVKL